MGGTSSHKYDLGLAANIQGWRGLRIANKKKVHAAPWSTKVSCWV